EIVEDDMDLASSVLSDNPVHEVEKFKPSPPLVLTPRHLARRNVESGEERRRAMPGVVVRLASQPPAVRHLQIALRALQRLDRRLLVGRLHVKADHRSRLGREIGIVAFAPALAPGEILWV